MHYRTLIFKGIAFKQTKRGTVPFSACAADTSHNDSLLHASYQVHQEFNLFLLHPFL